MRPLEPSFKWRRRVGWADRGGQVTLACGAAQGRGGWGAAGRQEEGGTRGGA